MILTGRKQGNILLMQAFRGIAYMPATTADSAPCHRTV
ncbi:hypothetical protein SXCC_00883 [Gluconacetobacter sp. SXCC-1]|nr:hypothetical protein SXCC_00883 [Gluconacetobacter sp. SXCC-1]